MLAAKPPRFTEILNIDVNPVDSDITTSSGIIHTIDYVISPSQVRTSIFDAIIDMQDSRGFNDIILEICTNHSFMKTKYTMLHGFCEAGDLLVLNDVVVTLLR